MTAINSLSQSTYMRQLINSQHDRLAELTRQSGSGYKSDSFSGLSAQDGRTSIAMRTELLRADAYKSTINTVSPRVQVAATTLDSMTKSLTEIRDTLVQLNTQDAQTGEQIRLAAEARFRQLVDRLNTKVGNIQIFAGRAGGTVPATDPTNYPVVAADTLLTNYAGSLGGPYASAAALTTATDAFFGSTGAALTNWFRPGDVNGVTADPTRISDTQTLETGLTALPDATEPNGTTAFRDALAVLAAVSTVDPTDFTGGVDEYRNFILDSISKLNTAIEGVNTVVGKVGEIGEILTEQKDVFADNALNLKKALTAAEEVDSVEVLTELKNRETQLEATYKVTAETRALSLFNYI
jgi:flagellin-like hook-associated protein FlgL